MFARTAIKILEEFVKNGGQLKTDTVEGFEVFAAVPKNPFCPNWTVYGATLKELAERMQSSKNK